MRCRSIHGSTDDGIDHIIMHRITQPQGKPPLLLPGKRILTPSPASHEAMSRQILADRIELARLHGKKITSHHHAAKRPSPLFPGRLKEYYPMGENAAQKLYDDGAVETPVITASAASSALRQAACALPWR
jgi:hypothetical protein